MWMHAVIASLLARPARVWLGVAALFLGACSAETASTASAGDAQNRFPDFRIVVIDPAVAIETGHVLFDRGVTTRHTPIGSEPVQGVAVWERGLGTRILGFDGRLINAYVYEKQFTGSNLQYALATQVAVCPLWDPWPKAWLEDKGLPPPHYWWPAGSSQPNQSYPILLEQGEYAVIVTSLEPFVTRAISRHCILDRERRNAFDEAFSESADRAPFSQMLDELFSGMDTTGMTQSELDAIPSFMSMHRLTRKPCSEILQHVPETIEAVPNQVPAFTQRRIYRLTAPIFVCQRDPRSAIAEEQIFTTEFMVKPSRIVFDHARWQENFSLTSVTHIVVFNMSPPRGGSISDISQGDPQLGEANILFGIHRPSDMTRIRSSQLPHDPLGFVAMGGSEDFLVDMHNEFGLGGHAVQILPGALNARVLSLMAKGRRDESIDGLELAAAPVSPYDDPDRGIRNAFKPNIAELDPNASLWQPPFATIIIRDTRSE